MAKKIMIQGTMSNAGKSLLVAALCRIFAQDGYRCAPFKSQNMALNSYITAEGLEMGRAQVMQAEAAGIEPSVWMNPILLKPTSDIGSQVIVNGKVQGNMRAMDYYRKKKELIPEIMKAFHHLEEENDIIVLEGAGSPAELNLKSDDIVNMGMAKLAKAPVLLVGDINLGGVFAQLLGTLMLLEKDEQALIKGLIVNKFRGDKRIFQDGVNILQERSKRPVLGVIPWLKCDLEEEDSVSKRLEQTIPTGLIDIAVIRLPRISNFTDFDVFYQFTDVSVRYISRMEQFGNPDFVILPGTKNTIEDLLWLRQCGLEALIKKYVSEGNPIFGICGGYQMLGKEIFDPEHTEAKTMNRVDGLGLLDIVTEYSGEKFRTRVHGYFREIGGIFAGLSGAEVEGYEIHMGRTRINSDKAENPINLLQLEDGRVDGVYVAGSVYGCYLHGVFDQIHAADEIVRALYKKKGLVYSAESKQNRKAYKQAQYDILANGVRSNLDMEQIYHIIDNGI